MLLKCFAHRSVLFVNEIVIQLKLRPEVDQYPTDLQDGTCVAPGTETYHQSFLLYAGEAHVDCLYNSAKRLNWGKDVSSCEVKTISGFNVEIHRFALMRRDSSLNPG